MKFYQIELVIVVDCIDSKIRGLETFTIQCLLFGSSAVICREIGLWCIQIIGKLFNRRTSRKETIFFEYLRSVITSIFSLFDPSNYLSDFFLDLSVGFLGHIFNQT